MTQQFHFQVDTPEKLKTGLKQKLVHKYSVQHESQ